MSPQTLALPPASTLAASPQPAAPLPSSNVELDPAIVRDALHGNPTAQEKLCAWHQRSVLTACHRVLARHSIPIDGQDLAQEVWSRLLGDACRRLRGFRAERGAFGPFLRMVAWQQASRVAKAWANRWRRTRAAEQRWRPSPAANLPGDDPVEHRQFLRRVVDVAEPELDSVDCALLQEIAQGDASTRELASDMGHSPSMLYKRRRRLRTKLITATRRLEAR